MACKPCKQKREAEERARKASSTAKAIRNTKGADALKGARIKANNMRGFSN